MADDVQLAESVSIAMLLVLETLTAAERAVFVLREVFDLDYDEIASTIKGLGGGLDECIKAEKMFRSWFADRRRNRMIP